MTHRRTALASLLATVTVGSVLLAPTRAAAGPTVTAIACKADALHCETAPIAFDRVDAAPIQWHFDTGWVPGGSPIQVDIAAAVYANTHVSLAGELATSWPSALTLKTPGDPMGGLLAFHYGATFSAQGKIDVSILGQKFGWQGNIPYAPEFALEVDASQPFPAWGFAPGFTVSSKTMQQQIASVDIANIIGGSIPGISGGFQLDVAIEITATYVTDRIVIATTDGAVVKGGPITTEDGQSSASYLSGPSIDLDVHPEGTVNYTGTVHMIPTFSVKILGQGFSIPVADIPVPIPLTNEAWVFDAQRVHVPLPDLKVDKTTLDFGDVAIGGSKLLEYDLSNVGEAKVSATMVSSDPTNFPAFDAASSLLPTGKFATGVTFTPTAAGDFSAKLVVASNDPDQPTQEIQLVGHAVDGSGSGAGGSGGSGGGTTGSGGSGGSGGDAGGATSEHGGCGCRAAGGEGHERGAGLVVGAAVFFAAARRRRRC